MQTTQRMSSWDLYNKSFHRELNQPSPMSQSLVPRNGAEMVSSSHNGAPMRPHWNTVDTTSVYPVATSMKNPLQTNSSLQPAPKETKSAVFEACKQQITVTRIIGVMIGLILAGIPLAVMVTLYLQPATTTAAPGSTTVNPAASTSMANSLPYQCTTFITSTDATRNVAYTTCLTCYCDTGGFNNWYRFTGAAGTRLVTSPPNINTCAAYYTGWFNGTLPTTVGATSIGTGCVNVNGALCQTSYSVPAVLATNCNGFYVFYLPNFPYCYTRFCTV